MPVTVKGTTRTAINDAAQCEAYLRSIYSAPLDPYTIHTRIRFTSRLGMPADAGAMNIGLFNFGRPRQPIISAMVLTTDGNIAVISVPKTNITRWTAT